MTTIFTIGHSNHALERLLGLLRRHSICTLVDVRSSPYSKFNPQFRKEPLARSLRAAGVEYVFLGDAVGGMPAGDEFYDGHGHVDYARRAQAPDFQAGVERLMGLAGTQPTTLLCAEENPARCHRHLLIAPALEAQGVLVTHIRGDGRLQTEQDLRDASPQLSLFR